MTYVIGTAGHVDHGKSTLVEALTGIDPDRLAEEKERQMTIDLGFAWLTLPSGTQVGVIDVPGHRDFIENMLAGVGGIDLALLVIAADESVMPQTREHLAILDLLGVSSGIIALTKTDLIDDPEWLELAILDVTELVAGTVMADAPIVPVSARTGEGLDTLRDVLDQALAHVPLRQDLGTPRLPVDRVFTISGFGTVVTGTLNSGVLRVGDEVEIAPRGIRARIRGLQSHKETMQSAEPGSRVAINLSGVSKDEVWRGEVVSLPGQLAGTTLVDVSFEYLADAGRPLKHNADVKFFSGAAESSAHARLVGDRELQPGQTGWLQLRLASLTALAKGDRFILRYPSPPQTIGGGVVLDAHPPHRWRRFKPEVVARYEVLAAGSSDEVVLHILSGGQVWTVTQIAEAAGLPIEETRDVVGRMLDDGILVQLDEQWVIANTGWRRLLDLIAKEAGQYHALYRLRSGMPREALRSRLSLEARVFNAVIRQAVNENVVVESGALLHLPGHSLQFSDKENRSVADLLGLFKAKPTAPPSVKEATALVGDEVLQALLEQGELVPIGGEVLFDPATYTYLVDSVKSYIQEHGSVTVAQARDLFQTSRKYVLPLLEHLDSTGITRRVGDQRVLR